MNTGIENTRMRAAIAIGSALLLAAIAGIGIGALWHERLPSWLGSDDETVRGQQDAPTQLWTCGMHPQVIQEEPGFCPICHMALTPLEVEGANRQSDTAITIDPAVVQNMGVKTAIVREGALTRTVRAVGRVMEAEPNVREVNLLVSGWIRRLYADTEGMYVRKHAPLFDLYSPELYAAVEEAIRLRRSAPQSELQAAAVRRLELWGLSGAQAERLSKLSRAPRSVTFTSPIAGVVLDKQVVEGAAVEAGESAMRIVDQSVLWIDAQVFEQHLGAIVIGQDAVAEVAALPAETFVGKVSFVHPHVDPDTRTATVRFEVDNTTMRLRPGMYATVALDVELARETLLVPREAVIDTGVRQVAFVALGGGHFEARDVTIGASDAAGTVQVLDGLVAGERVVTSGQFLLDSESRLRETVQKFLREREGSGAQVEAPAADASRVTGTSEPGLYTCPMHPDVQQEGPGQCPICHMDLVPSEAGAP